MSNAYHHDHHDNHDNHDHLAHHDHLQRLHQRKTGCCMGQAAGHGSKWAGKKSQSRLSEGTTPSMPENLITLSKACLKLSSTTALVIDFGRKVKVVTYCTNAIHSIVWRTCLFLWADKLSKELCCASIGCRKQPFEIFTQPMPQGWFAPSGALYKTILTQPMPDVTRVTLDV